MSPSNVVLYSLGTQAILPDCTFRPSILPALLPENDEKNEARDISAVSTLTTVIRTCTGILTLTISPATVTFTYSLAGGTVFTRTQTVNATTEIWRATTTATSLETSLSDVPWTTATNSSFVDICLACSRPAGSESSSVRPTSSATVSSTADSTISAPESTSTPLTPTTSTTSTATSPSTSKPSTGNPPIIFTAVIPAIFGSFILLSCILFFYRRRRRRRRNTNTNNGNNQPTTTTTSTERTNIISQALSRLSNTPISPLSGHHTLRPEDSLSQRDPFEERGRRSVQDSSAAAAEAQRESLLRKARERFLERDSAVVGTGET